MPSGQWVVWAHMWMLWDSSTVVVPPLPVAQCVVGSHEQPRQAASHTARVGNELGRTQLVLNIAYDHGADGGTFRLRCREVSAEASISHIRLVAYRARELTSVPLAGGASSTVGSSLPKVVHGYRDAGVALGSAPVSIGQLDLVPGIWWIRATANLVRNVDGEDFEAVVTCSLATRDSQNGPRPRWISGAVPRCSATTGPRHPCSR